VSVALFGGASGALMAPGAIRRSHLMIGRLAGPAKAGHHVLETTEYS
jgi:hypothetical protein